MDEEEFKAIIERKKRFIGPPAPIELVDDEAKRFKTQPNTRSTSCSTNAD